MHRRFDEVNEQLVDEAGEISPPFDLDVAEHAARALLLLDRRGRERDYPSSDDGASSSSSSTTRR